MRSTVASAKTRQEAIQKALEDLGVELHEVEIEIVEEGSKGIFGFGAREWSVKVSAAHLPDLPKEKPRRPEKPRQEAEPQKHGRPERGERPERADRPARTERPERADRSGKPQKPPHVQQREQQQQQRQQNQQRPPKGEKGGRPDRGPKQGGPARPDQQSRRQNKPDRPPPPDRPPRQERPPRPTDENGEPRPPEADLPPLTETERQEAANLLTEICAKMGYEVKVTDSPTEFGGVVLNIESPDSAILIGHKGRTLQSLQYVLNRMVRTPGTTETSERILVDVENYRDRRKQALVDMALELAKKAKETQREIRAKPLTAPERRVIHLTLKDDPDIETFSRGTGPQRSVVIAPKDLPRGQRHGGGDGGGGGGGSRGQRRGGADRRGPRPHSRRGSEDRGPRSSEERDQATPADEAPIEVPIEAPIEAPIEVPIEAPIKAPIEAPIETPREEAASSESQEP